MIWPGWRRGGGDRKPRNVPPFPEEREFFPSILPKLPVRRFLSSILPELPARQFFPQYYKITCEAIFLHITRITCEVILSTILPELPVRQFWSSILPELPVR